MTELAEKLISETASSKFKFLLGRVKAEKQLPSDSKQQLISKRCIQQSLLQSEHIANHRIPKYLRFVNLDEKFLQHCLDLVEFRAANSLSMICSPAVPCNVAVNLRSSKQVFYDNHLEPHRNMRRNRSDLGNFVVHCPSATQSGQWILKTVDEKECGKDVLNDSLLCHLGALAFAPKMVDMFRPKHLPKHKSCSQFGTESYVREHISWEADTSSNVGRLGAKIFQAGPPNVELAAVVLREEAHDSHQETVVGGWGLKFLQKARVGCANTSQVAPVSSEPSQESRLRDMGDCSTSMNVIIPAGAHGGPGTRNGGPSSLTERWRSGGHCDCGGWDIGFPLTVLTSRPSKEI